MDTQDSNYHVSLFKPKTPHAKANRDMVILFFCIWAVAIFGFQILLKIFEKPTPEASYVAFEKVWPSVKSGSGTEQELQVFAGSVLSVLGKIAIEPEDRLVLQKALSWSVYQLADEEAKSSLKDRIGSFEKVKGEITSISDQGYIDAKVALSKEISPVLGLKANDVRARILPLELTSAGMEKVDGENLAKVKTSMSLYLIHNQSFLTDFKFLGFPFHYFYTAILLLILFVGLCWLYCYRTDVMNKKFNIAD